jgi:hypothetical protein
MDVTSIKSKEEFLATLQKNPEMVAFEGWDRYGTPKLTDSGQKQTWRTAQAQPWYDKDVEVALIGAGSTLGGSAQAQAFPNADNTQMPPKHVPAMTEVPAGQPFAASSGATAPSLVDELKRALFRSNN